MKYLTLCAFVLVLMSCETSQTPEVATPEIAAKEIDAMEQELRKQPDIKHHTSKAESLVKLYKGFVDNNPQHEKSPEYLFKAAEVQMGLKKFEDAIRTLERLNTHYKNFDKRPEAMFIIAFIYENELDQKGQAKEAYEAVIEAFPRHELAIEARSSIKLIFMTDEEKIQYFQEQNAKKAGGVKTES